MSDRGSTPTQPKRSDALGKRSRTDNDDPNHSTSTKSNSELAQSAEAQTADTKRFTTDRETSLTKELEETKAELEKMRKSRFIMCRSNLLTALVKKLFRDIVKKTARGRTSQEDDNAGHKITKLAALAGSFREADIKKATKDFEISQNSKEVVRVLKKYSQVSLTPPRSCHNSGVFDI